jgi:hypothetical protein
MGDSELLREREVGTIRSSIVPTSAAVLEDREDMNGQRIGTD